MNFSQCQETQSGKFIWNSEDTTYGMDVPVWKQKSFDIDCADEEECVQNCNYYYAEYNKQGINTKRCYSYEVLDSICLLIEYDPILDEYVQKGGCFKDNKHYLMVTAQLNKIYHFDDIEIEVRNYKDPVVKAGQMSNYSYSYGEDWV